MLFVHVLTHACACTERDGHADTHLGQIHGWIEIASLNGERKFGWGLPVRANYHTLDLTNMNLHWKMPLTIHWTILVTSTGEVTILRKVPLTSGIPLENTSEHSRLFPRC